MKPERFVVWCLGCATGFGVGGVVSGLTGDGVVVGILGGGIVVVSVGTYQVLRETGVLRDET